MLALTNMKVLIRPLGVLHSLSYAADSTIALSIRPELPFICRLVLLVIAGRGSRHELMVD
jgi:hypothetical protein